MEISSFSGPYRFLSNFYLLDIPVLLQGVPYNCTENAYQAAKTDDMVWRDKIRVAGPAEAKRLGMKVPLRSDWETIKLSIMAMLNFQKFDRNADLGHKLRATAPAELIEGNYWGDRYWGVCNGVGENHLGKILMAVRAII